MQRRIKAYIKAHSLLHKDDLCLVAVSGGMDSVALLHLLHSLAYKCIVLHCNFQLRGEESDRDESCVRELSASLQIPIYIESFDTKAYAKEKAISIEMAARDLRYEWFEKMRIELSADEILVAHHADDVVETFLMNIVRGAGIHGLTGIKPRNGHIVRPLLSVNRLEIEQYIKQHKLAYVTDSSNHEELYLRNKFRHSVIPLLETLNPSLRSTILSEIECLKGVELVFNKEINRISHDLLAKDEDLVSINIEKLKQQDSISTVLFELLNQYGFSASQVKSIEEALDKESGKQYLSNTHRLVKDRLVLLISPLKVSNQVEYLIDKFFSNIDLPIQLTALLHESGNYTLIKSKSHAYLDYSKLQFPLVLRRWKQGDVFVPFGMKGRKKLSDFFVDEKFSLLQKEQVWVLCSGDDIVWVVGQRIDNRYRVQNALGSRVLELKL